MAGTIELILTTLKIIKNNMVSYILVSLGIAAISIVFIPFVLTQVLYGLNVDIFTISTTINALVLILTYGLGFVALFGITNDILEIKEAKSERFIYYIKKYWIHGIIVGAIGYTLYLFSQFIENSLYRMLIFDADANRFIVKSIYYFMLSLFFMYINLVLSRLVSGGSVLESVKYSLVDGTKSIKNLLPSIIVILTIVYHNRIALALFDYASYVLFYVMFVIIYFEILILIVWYSVNYHTKIISRGQDEDQSEKIEDSAIQLLGGL